MSCMCCHQADWLLLVYNSSSQQAVTLHVAKEELRFFTWPDAWQIGMHITCP